MKENHSQDYRWSHRGSKWRTGPNGEILILILPILHICRLHLLSPPKTNTNCSPGLELSIALLSNQWKKLSKVRDWLRQIGSKASSAREALDQDCPKVPQSSLPTMLLYLFVFVLLGSHLFLIMKQIMKGEGCLVCGNRGRQSQSSVQGQQGVLSFFHYLHFEFLMKMKKKRFSFRYKSMSCFQMTSA